MAQHFGTEQDPMPDRNSTDLGMPKFTEATQLRYVRSVMQKCAADARYWRELVAKHEGPHADMLFRIERAETLESVVRDLEYALGEQAPTAHAGVVKAGGTAGTSGQP